MTITSTPPETTPDYSVFSKIRKKIGTNLLSKIFANFREQLRKQGYIPLVNEKLSKKSASVIK